MFTIGNVLGKEREKREKTEKSRKKMDVLTK
jgi:hypothetical protein